MKRAHRLLRASRRSACRLLGEQAAAPPRRALSPSQLVRTGAPLRCATRLDHRLRGLDAARRRAVGQFSTRIASTPWSSNRTVQRVGVALRRRVADDVDRIAARPGRRQHRVEAPDASPARARRAGRRHRSDASVASTPTPPPLVRIASRSPLPAPRRGQGLDGVEQLLQRVARAACRRGGTRRRRPRRRRRARRCARRRPRAPSACRPGLDHDHRLERAAAARAADMNLRAWVIAST